MDKLFECREMFLQAHGFSKCAKIAMEGGIECSTPAIVNYAFACEVYLKSLLYFSDISFKKKHELKELFDLLPEKYKESIMRLTLAECGSWDDYSLDNISNAFIEWRYSYETIGKKRACMRIETGFLVALNNALRELCTNEFFGITYNQFGKTYLDKNK